MLFELNVFMMGHLEDFQVIGHLDAFFSQLFSGHLEDFHHLHQIVINFGSPEVFYAFLQTKHVQQNA